MSAVSHTEPQPPAGAPLDETSSSAPYEQFRLWNQPTPRASEVAVATPPIDGLTDAEFTRAQESLRDTLRHVRDLDSGFKEGHWAQVLSTAWGIDVPPASNLPFHDFVAQGVESKLLGIKKGIPPYEKSVLLPALTRRIPQFVPLEDDANDVMRRVLESYCEDIQDFRRRYRETSPSGPLDVRLGVTLYARETLGWVYYFELPLKEPDPQQFSAQWKERTSRGRTSATLEILDKSTGHKVYSVTAPKNGAKLQGYLVVPRGGRLFSTPPESIDALWLPTALIAELRDAGIDAQDALLAAVQAKIATRPAV